MSFTAHTTNDIATMLSAIGANSIDDLFSEIPADLRLQHTLNIPAAKTELEMAQLMQQRADCNANGVCFIGAGAYDHAIPSAIWDIAQRGEFLTAYTPYQAEASQGTLQVLYEFQTMIASLAGLPVANASLYDGASALAEAILMALRLKRRQRSQNILIAGALNPRYLAASHAIVVNQDIHLQQIAVNPDTGLVAIEALKTALANGAGALVIPFPNYFGLIDDVDALVDLAKSHDVPVIACVNPLTMALFKAPGHWGEHGVDIVCGEAQPLGIPLASGGPYCGFLCCSKEGIRQLPGRIVARTVDHAGKPGFTLTLQAREQHIRRAKATSNICTNQGLLVTAATLYMALLGPEGLKQVAAHSHQQTRALIAALISIPGVKQQFNAPFAYENVITLPQAADSVLAKLAERGILGGHALCREYPELPNSILICATEKRTATEIAHYQTSLQEVLATC